MSRVWNRLRGRYEGADLYVTSKYWWSRKDRESARLTAAVLEYHRGRLPQTLYIGRSKLRGRREP